MIFFKYVTRFLPTTASKRVINMLWRFAKSDDVLTADGTTAHLQWKEMVDFINASMPPVQTMTTTESAPPGLCNCLGCITSKMVASDIIETDRGTAEAAVLPLALPILSADSTHCRIAWINRMWDRRRQWARRYILSKGVLTLDIRSSQRCESVNAVFAKVTDRGMTLCKSLDVLDEMESFTRINYRDLVRTGQNYSISPSTMCCYKPFLLLLRGKVTQFAYHKCEQEALRADRYTHC